MSFNTDDQYQERYIIIVEVIDGEIPKIHLVPVPSWLVYYSKEYRYNPINLN